ncbi:GNAT superfamily N-acetyltransferase [Streptomyces ambofaciens]
MPPPSGRLSPCPRCGPDWRTRTGASRRSWSSTPSGRTRWRHWWWGTLEYRIGGPDRPANGLIGYVFSVATDPDARRRGYARACMDELLEWFRERGAGHVMLTASPDAEPLYASMGFTHDTTPSMRRYL